MDAASPGLLSRFADRAAGLARGVAPAARTWNGAALGLFAGITTILAIKVTSLFARGVSGVVLGVLIGVVFALVAGLAVVLLVRLLSALPVWYRLVLAGALVLLPFEVYSGTLRERLSPTLFVVVISTVAGAALSVLWRARKERIPFLRLLLAFVAFAGAAGLAALGLRALYRDGFPNAPAVNAAAVNAASVPELDLPDPSEPGPHRAKRLTYGGGKDWRRPEYGERADLRTRPVDASPFLRGWGGFDGWARARYWEVDPRALPLNARVFYPDAEGPFPLFVIIHGGHPMDDFSEPGYDYLGEHLATHGFVVVSIDENFLNGAPWAEFLGGLGNENGARAFLALEHIKALRAMSADAASPLHDKIDTNRVAVAGHSKGGEAAALVALYNQLPRHPDDATLPFRYGFGIRAVIALSTIDKQTQPGGAPVRLANVDFLALQGSNDGDVDSFLGMGQHDRVRFDGAGYHFKAAVFVHGANHGQWNRVWARNDKTRFPKKLAFNRKPIMPAAQQERIAKAYLAAFLSASLEGDTRWLPFLRDHRAGRRWLPETIYVTRFDDSTRRYVATFEEDVDPTTTTLLGGACRGEGLTVWREQPPNATALWSTMETRAAFVGWDASGGGGPGGTGGPSGPSGTGGTTKTASYTVELPASLDATVLDPGSSLVFALADANEPANPRRRGAAPRSRNARPPIDLTVELVDRDGRVARVPLGEARLLQPQLEPTVWKSGPVIERREIVFQTFEMPLGWFAERNGDLVIGDLAAVRFVFDRTAAGVVAVDDIGFAPTVEH